MLQPTGLGTIFNYIIFNYDKKLIFLSQIIIFLTIIIIVIIYCFSFFFSAGSVNPAARASKPKGGQNRTRRLSLHLAHGSHVKNEEEK